MPSCQESKPGTSLVNLLNLPEIGDESFHFFFASRLIWGAQYRRRMHRGHHVRSERRFQEFASMLRDAKIAAQQRLRCSGAKADNYFWMQGCNFSVKPRFAGSDFCRIRFFVNAPLA